MSEEKDCSSVAGVQAGLRPTDEPRFAGLARFARDVLQNPWEGYDLDGGEIQDLGIKHGLIYETKFDPELHIDLHGVGPHPGDEWYVEQPWLAEFAKSSEEQCISPSKASAGTPATDDHKYSISPSPLPEGLDLAELKRVGRDLSNRLRGRYAKGPLLPNGEPEFGWSVFDAMPDGKPFPSLYGEAAAFIDRLLSELGGRDALLRAAERTVADYCTKASDAIARLTRTEADLSRALEALGPFAAAVGYAIGSTTSDHDSIEFAVGPFRRASEVYTTLSVKGEGSSRSQPCADAQERSPEAPHSGGGGER